MLKKRYKLLFLYEIPPLKPGKEFRNMSADTEEIKRKILDLQLTEEERDAQRALNLEKIIQLRIAEEIAIGSGQLSEDELAAKLARRLELYKKELELRTEIKAKEDKPEPSRFRRG